MIGLKQLAAPGPPKCTPPMRCVTKANVRLGRVVFPELGFSYMSDYYDWPLSLLWCWFAQLAQKHIFLKDEVNANSASNIYHHPSMLRHGTHL